MADDYPRYTVDAVREIWVDGEKGVHLDIGPDREGLGCVELRTPTNGSLNRSEEYFGKVAITFEPKLARVIAMAMLKCADEVEAAAGRK